MKKLLNFIKNNWFKLALLIAIFWFFLMLQNGIEIDIDIDHSGYIKDSFGLPGLPSL